MITLHRKLHCPPPSPRARVITAPHTQKFWAPHSPAGSWKVEINPHFPSSHVRAELEALSSCQSRLSVRGSPFQPPITDLIQVQLILCIRGCVTEQNWYHIADKYSEELPPSKEQGNNKQPRWVLVTFGKFALPESSPFQSTSLTLKAIANFWTELKVIRCSETRDSKIINENREQVMRVWDIFVLIFQKSLQDRKTLLNSLRSQLI